MNKIRNSFKMIRLFIRLVYELLHNRSSLNDDVEHNFKILQKISRTTIESAGIHLVTNGISHIPATDDFLLVSNHRCFFDVIFIIASLNRSVSFVAAEELWHYPVLRRYLDAISCIALDRYATELTKLKENIKKMKEAIINRNVVLFPEGECSYLENKMKPFKKGGFMGISNLDVTIVPAYININTIHHIGRWMIPEGTVSVTFGTPFLPKDVNAKGAKANELAEYAQKQVETLMENE